jgi:hypothetical protein
LLLVNANMTEHGVPFIRGRYYDYSSAWYSDVGQKLTQTMLINSIMPWVGLLTAVVIPKVK